MVDKGLNMPMKPAIIKPQPFYLCYNFFLIRKHENDIEQSIDCPFFFLLGFTPCKAEEPYKAWSYKKKKHKKINAYRKPL